MGFRVGPAFDHDLAHELLNQQPFLAPRPLLEPLPNVPEFKKGGQYGGPPASIWSMSVISFTIASVAVVIFWRKSAGVLDARWALLA